MRAIFAASLVCAAATALSSGPLTGQEAAPLRVTTRAAEVTVGGRVQTQFSTTSVDGAVPALWELRRARLELGVRLNPLVSGRLHAEFAGSQAQLRDAFVQLDVSPGLQLLAGQAYRPFSLIAQTSSTRILPIERGARIRGLASPPLEHYNLVSTLGYSERDVGFQLRGAPAGAPLGLTYALGVFNGPLMGEADDELTYQLAVRTTVRLAPELRAGLGWSQRDFARTAAGAPSPELRRGAAWQADLEYGDFAPGPHLVAEFAVGDHDPFAEEGGRFRSAQLWAAWRSAPRGAHGFQVEPLIRVSHGAVDATDAQRADGAAGGLLLTPGINLYIGPLNRFMLNYDFWSPAGDAEAEGALRAMFQLAF